MTMPATGGAPSLGKEIETEYGKKALEGLRNSRPTAPLARSRFVDDLPSVLTLADRAQHAWLNYARGLVRYRLGRFEEAIRVIQSAQQKKELELGEESSTGSEDAERAILNRIMVAHTDLLKQYGPQKVMQAAEEVAYNVGDVDEIGSSDVSAYVHEVGQILGA